MTDQIAERQFVHLHVHTEYSLLDGLAKVDKLVKAAAERKFTALAISDHGAMHGVISFYRACIANGIKPIIGMEGYLAHKDMRVHDSTEKSPFHLLLLARNATGYQNLLKIASAAQLEGFYNRPRFDKDFLARHAEGLICTSGCMAAEIPKLVIDGRDDEARRVIGWYQDVFGAENFFLELQSHDIEELFTINRWLVENRDYARVPLLATNDVHYINASDAEAHDTLLCIQTGAKKVDTKRMKMTDPSYFLRSTAEMWDIFHEVPEALTNTVLVADMCEMPDWDKKGYHLPMFPVPEGYDAESYLRYLSFRGLEWRYGQRAHTDATLQERLNYELGIIHKMGFDTYFLIVWDLCQFALHADIWWNVRGSGAGSVTAYVLGITNIDPVANALIFERFLNPGRVSMPDIDMDFPDDRRGEMIDYAMRKYGQDKVAAIITFGTLKARAAIKDVGRVFDYPLPLVNSLTKLVPQIPSRPVTLGDVLGDDPEKVVPELKDKYEHDPEIRKLLENALLVEGMSRNVGTHAAGVVISDKPLVEYIPVHRPIGDTRLTQVTQFAMEICESIGLLKVDFLGLSTLTIMRKACDLIEKYHGIKFDMDNIPYRADPNDMAQARKVAALFELIGNGETTGVFQLESGGMKRMLIDMKPKTYEHIIAAISLYRPGPMDLIPTYIRRMHGEEPVMYKHPKLEPILSETYGIAVYQEQLQQIAAQLFGYSLGDADLMRRAVSKKKKKDLDTHKQIFIDRGPQFGVSAEVAESIFADIEFFAAYGFNKCVVGSTLIVDADTGALISVGDIAAGRVSVARTVTLDEVTGQLTIGEIRGVYANGVKPVYRLLTDSGRSITATANHPFLTAQGWRWLGDLHTNDEIAVPCKRLMPERNRILMLQPSNAGAYLVDRMVADVIEQGVEWDRVVSIEYAGEQPTYDLTIPGTHNFVANDIIVHNSHAADYAVLTCQTAYLKAHYPEEYYTALLSVQRNVPKDVALFINDCRRFGIPVLPPDINASDVDFTIEPVTGKTGKHGKHLRGIRYGMSAVKNAGEKAIQEVIRARSDGGTFMDISDFARRVDLRILGKKALESLIRVGCFDTLADRDDLLASLDRILKYSADQHRAKEIGQFSLFGDSAVSADQLDLVHVGTHTDSRERRRWEVDLIGLAVSEHPIGQVKAKLHHLPNLIYINAMRDDEEINGRPVTLVGMVMGFREILTKNNDNMGIVTLEDETGQIECVMFPRTWKRFRELITQDTLVIVKGKADTSRGDPQIIVDEVSQNLEIVEGVGNSSQWTAPIYNSSAYAVASGDEYDAPPPPDDLPLVIPDDIALETAHLTEPPPRAVAESVSAVSPEAEQTAQVSNDEFLQNDGNGQHGQAAEHDRARSGNGGGMRRPMTFREELLFDDDEFEARSSEQPRVIVLSYRRSGDDKRDKRFIEMVLNKCRENPGPDHVRLRLIGADKIVTVDFPSYNTVYEAIKTFLWDRFGSQNVVTEPYIHQPEG